MTQAELYTILKSTNIPCQYLKFSTAPTIPFMVYLEESRDNISADDKVWYKFKNFRIELYTASKSPATELLLETALDNAGIFYETSDVGLIESESLYEVIYYVTL